MTAIFALVYILFGAKIYGTEDAYYSLAALIRQALLLSSFPNGVTWSIQLEVLTAPFIFALCILPGGIGHCAKIVVFSVLTWLAFTDWWNNALGSALLLNTASAFAAGMLVPSSGRLLAERFGNTIWLISAIVFLLVAEPCFGFLSGRATFIEAVSCFVIVSVLASDDTRAELITGWSFVLSKPFDAG
jgi:hypothetical protein